MEEPKPWKAEYAKSGRARCHVCQLQIGKDEFRLGRTVKSDKFSGWMQNWHHFDCVFDGTKMISSVEDIDGFHSARWEDQQRLRKCIEGDNNDDEDHKDDSEEDDNDGSDDDEPGEESDDGEPEEEEVEEKDSGEKHTIETAKTSRSQCRVCKEKIMNKTARIATVLTGSPTFRHVKCFLELGTWKRPIEEMTGWDELDDEEQSKVKDIAKPFQREKKKREAETSEDAAKSPKKQKVSKEDAGKSPKKQKVSEEDNDLEKKLKRQSKALWTLIDNLRHNVSKEELKEMLEINGAAMSRSEDEILQRCADGMLFGPLKACQLCKGPLAYQDEQYCCKGNISEWSRCNNITREVERDAIWKIPKSSATAFLRSWYKSQPKEKEPRALRPQSTRSSDSSFLRGLHVYFLGDPQQKSQDEWKTLLESAGGVFHESLNNGVTVIVSTDAEVSRESSEGRWRTSGIPVVGERYLTDCLEKKMKLHHKEYRLELPQTRTVAKVKVKGRGAVHEDSDMQDQGHILEVGNTVYNVTLNLTDLSRGLNKYYVLQIIEEDKSSHCHLFRRWGDVGVPTVGGKKIEQLGKHDAIQGFRTVFLQKTGNEWGDKDYRKQEGLYFPVEIDYGVDEGPQKGLAVSDGSRSRLHPRVISVMRMLFDIEAYRAAMLEFEIDAAKMPLGKLSKRHIARGFEVLTQVEQFLKMESEADRRIQLIDASNKFYTLIPTVNPTIITNEDALKSKIQMLEALRDIEIASQLISSADGDDDSDPFDLHYRKLKCEVSPLDHDSPEFELVKAYLERTHAPTHTEWGLEVEDVFVVKREGEDESYAPMKSSLDNKMLLWHGSRTTNFVGILSQGLRIAPPEAPVTGYMFGKGVYFADLVSKSAQYCFTSKANPIGLMLLSEVALGNVKEYTHAQYMEKPPTGYDSTKGVGRSMPERADFKVLEDNIVVPCGRPVPAKIASNLLYNEYIVYSTSQIKLRFLLKVRFKHKR